MPGLQSFCICTALALGAIYLLQITWFVAWMSLDEKRIASGRNGCLPCIVDKTSIKSTGTTEDFGKRLIKKYTKLLSSTFYKICVAVITLILITFGIWGCINIKQGFDFLRMLPEDSYLRRWTTIKEDLYPDSGWPAEVYTEGFNHSDLASFENLTASFQELKESGLYIKSKH